MTAGLMARAVYLWHHCTCNMITLVKTTRPAAARDTLVILDDAARLRDLDLERNDRQYLSEQLQHDGSLATCDISGRLIMVHLVNREEGNGGQASLLEKARRAGEAMARRLNELRRTEAQLSSFQQDPTLTLALAEGVALGTYAFTKYKTDKKGAPTLEKLSIIAKEVNAAAAEELADISDATWMARDLVNEPLSFLTARQLSAEIKDLGKSSGFKVQVLDKSKIEAMGMGGLLAVNKGSPDEPTFNILEWKPPGAVNKRPLLLVGKGVVYDTGGLSLKPTPNSMDQMKCDMAGAAAVAGAITAAARQKLPLHVIGLIPATDNRPGGNAYVPGDILHMHNGITVEVMNTDAEGRLILADALSFGEQYDAELVITVATLTGSAARAIGHYATVGMGTASQDQMNMLEQAGQEVHERVVWFPFWDEYAEEIKSDVADIKNLGGESAGAITAGKFLARFTTRPFIHLDIAGPAFLTKRDAYRTRGGTGVGVRSLYEFMKRRSRA
jgi:leucyl aminopeptidase